MILSNANDNGFNANKTEFYVPFKETHSFSYII